MEYSKNQLQPIIKNFGIDVENDTNFKEIIGLFPGQTPYHIWALNLFYNKIASIEIIRAIRMFSIKYKTMINKFELQNIVRYKTKEQIKQLLLEMTGAKAINDVKNCIERFNTAQRGLLKDYMFGKGNTDITPLEASKDEFLKKASLFRKFDNLHIVNRNNVISLLSACYDINSIIKGMKEALKTSYSWNREDLLDFIKRDKRCKDVKVVYDNNGIVVLEIPTFEASRALCYTRTQWCLTREESHFNNYANSSRRSKQYFYFDFNKDERSEVAHVGFTIEGTKIIYAHSTSNANLVTNGVEASINGKSGIMKIEDILDAAHVGMEYFYHLNGLTNYNWNFDSARKFAKEQREMKVVYENKHNGIIIVKASSPSAFNLLCSNTLINYNNLFNDSVEVYCVLDTTKDINNANCMVTVVLTKDMFGSCTILKILNAYEQNMEQKEFFDTFNLTMEDICDIKALKKEIMLHKYIYEKNETEAVNLLNDNDFDVNYKFNEMSPIFVASNNKMYKTIFALLNHPRFDFNTRDAIDEPLLQRFIYDYRRFTMVGGEQTDFANIIKSLINNPNYDCNTVNCNLDSPLMVAAENNITNWIVKLLLAKDGINVNLVNDVNRTALGNAMFFKNEEAVKMLADAHINMTEEDTSLAANYATIVH